MTRRRDDLRGAVGIQTSQPVLLGQYEALVCGIGFVVLVVIGNLEFGEQLIDGIHVIGAIMVCRSFRAALTLPSFCL
jgi:hypothetical protein